MFRADPTRADDPVLAVLLGQVQPADRWLDVGAGAGRFALPLALALRSSGGEVVALDPSPSMLGSLREIAAEHRIDNVRTVEARWPLDPARAEAGAQALAADVVLIAHVGYDVAEIGLFIAALEAAARRSCIAVLMDRVPASASDPFWPLVHGQVRDPLPALPDFLDLLAARGKAPTVTRVPTPGRTFESRAALEGFVRRQLWIDSAGPSEARFQAALDELAVTDDSGWLIAGRGQNEIGVVAWRP
jgi:SAM-dependent methyltransferase